MGSKKKGATWPKQRTQGKIFKSSKVLKRTAPLGSRKGSEDLQEHCLVVVMLRHLLVVSALLQCGWPSCVDGFVGSVYRAKYVTVLRRVDVKPSVVAVGKREVKNACAARRVPPH